MRQAPSRASATSRRRSAEALDGLPPTDEVEALLRSALQTAGPAMRDEGLLSGALQPDEAAFEAGLRPAAPGRSSSARRSSRSGCRSSSRRRRGGASRWTTCSSAGLPDWARPPWRPSWPRPWAPSSGRPPVRPWSGPGTWRRSCRNLERGDVMFIDEIHRLPRVVEEILYSAMEDFHLDVVVGKGPAARSIRLDLPRLHPDRGHHPGGPGLGAAARPFRLPGAHRLLPAATSWRRWWGGPPASSTSPSTTAGGARSPARSRGTPRVANRLLRRVRDFAAVRAEGRVDAATALRALEVFEVDRAGLDRVDRAILEAVVLQVRRRPGGPVHAGHRRRRGARDRRGRLRAVPAAAGHACSARRAGRIATALAYRHLGGWSRRRRSASQAGPYRLLVERRGRAPRLAPAGRAAPNWRRRENRRLRLRPARGGHRPGGDRAAGLRPACWRPTTSPITASATCPACCEPGDLVVVNRTRVRRGPAARAPEGTGGAGGGAAAAPAGRRAVGGAGAPGAPLCGRGPVCGSGRLLAVVAEPARGGPGWSWSPPGADSRRRPGASGEVPLPPYFNGRLDDPERYQTVYAERRRVGGGPDRRAALHPGGARRPGSGRGSPSWRDRSRDRAGHLPADRGGADRGSPHAPASG